MYISLMVGRHFNQFMLIVYPDNLDYCVGMARNEFRAVNSNTLKMINNAHREITLGLVINYFAKKTCSGLMSIQFDNTNLDIP